MRCPNCGFPLTEQLVLLKTLRQTTTPHTVDGYPLYYCADCGTIFVNTDAPNIQLQNLLHNEANGKEGIKWT